MRHPLGASLNIRHNLSFFFNDTATTEIYTLSLHDALPISFSLVFVTSAVLAQDKGEKKTPPAPSAVKGIEDRKSTRLNSSHGYISYAVFCLKKKKYNIKTIIWPSLVA